MATGRRVTRDFGRHVYGAAAVVLGALLLYWHDVKTWPQLQAFGHAPYREVVVYAAAAAALVGGFAIQWRRTAQLGAAVLGILYLVFAASWIPGIVRSPLVYDRWANFFEQFSYVPGALIVFASAVSSRVRWARGTAAVGRVLFGVCVVSFALEQVFNLRVTADFVPKWVPPGQMFWAIATTIAFALAAVAIMSGRQALLASRLLTVMLVLFGLLIWVPALFAAPHSHFNWSENTENLAIAGVAWVLADYSSRTGRGKISGVLPSRRA